MNVLFGDGDTSGGATADGVVMTMRMGGAKCHVIQYGGMEGGKNSDDRPNIAKCRCGTHISSELHCEAANFEILFFLRDLFGAKQDHFSRSQRVERFSS